MAVVAEEIILPDSHFESLHCIFEQSAVPPSDGHATKRRKVTKANSRCLVDGNGESATGIPRGYIPLARLTLHMKSSSSAVLKREQLQGLDLLPPRVPVITEVRNIRLLNDDDDDGDSALQKDSLRHEPYAMELQIRDLNETHTFSHLFQDSRLFELLEQLQHASGLIHANKYSNQTPIACYQASISVSPGKDVFSLHTVVLWKDSIEIPVLSYLQDPVLEIFTKYVLQEHLNNPSTPYDRKQRREQMLGSPQHWSPREFYKSVHVPRASEGASNLTCPGIDCSLFPFQKRALRWLLEREGMAVQQDGTVVPTKQISKSELPMSFGEMKCADGQTFYFSRLFMILTTDISKWYDSSDILRGGILAEEMGLGKTVEMIALISLNRRISEQQPKADPDGLKPSGATLIITPPAILGQWKQELTKHAPDLRVHVYTGIKRGKEETDDMIVDELAEFDVVLTTYPVISREIHYVSAVPARNFRHTKRFEPRKTPLVRIQWWRVCLDEAQMIESGVSNAAKVARLIPREIAWAVTGTPLRKDIDDLFGLLLFLHYGPFCFSNPLWKRLFSRFGPVLTTIINKITLRHSKDQVRDELRLPPQKRIVITTPFTAIEEQHYRQLFEQMCAECGLDDSGAPLRETWDPEDPIIIEKMRVWLTRLRKTCLHPEVSSGTRRALGANNGPLRTVDEVLEVMIEANETAIRAEERSLLLSQLRRGQLLENAKRRMEALVLWQKSLDHATKLVETSREQLRQQRMKSDSATDGINGMISAMEHLNDDEAEDSNNSRIGQYRLRLRNALEVQHIAVFFTANAFYQIKSDPSLTQPDSDEFKSLEKREEDGYEAAKNIRKEMLTDISRKVERYMKTIKEKTRKKQFVTIPKMKPNLYSEGLESYRLLRKFEDLCAALNKHAEQYNEWRAAMVKLVSQSLIDQEEDAELEGNEYERSTKHQDEMYVYMEALRSMYADRHDALTGQKNVLISHEVKAGLVQAQRGEGPSPQLFLKIMDARSELMPDPQLGSLRGIVGELRTILTSLDWQASSGSSRARAEHEIVHLVLKNAGQMMSDQLKVSSNLEKEVEMFRDTMNNRLEFYRHLQQISDTVAPYDEESAGKPLDDELFNSRLRQEEILDGKISSLKSKGRYLIHLRDDSSVENTSRICIICQSTFEVGVLTVCGHKYCSDCIRMWWRSHKTCPVCKKTLKLADFHQITYKPQELVAQEEESSHKQGHEQHAENAIYSDISSGLLREIKNIELNDSFGTKIDTLARHILWLREHDPGAKSIVFSQYKSFLTVLYEAFCRFKIVSSSIDRPDGIESFKRDPTVECFLLHGKAQSSGLTLINATHVFLCEPLINTAIELQAIARVHRIGQHQPTTVWMYLVSGTVEESIYQLSVTRRLAHIIEKEKHEKTGHSADAPNGNGHLIEDLTETALDSANSMEMQEASLAQLMTSGPSDGELVKQDDLWQCLYGNTADKDGNKSSMEAEREVGRFLRGEAAEHRRGE
ncbi:uncharacterized protein N7511_009767 [Penicillium nucicola]|uniref:uncharacterized protein n=1 Tax=Penicillium nucicola TaxID=1850975 RepID=UPI00254507B6|nr:uncharacterized protein N7511_009767 [Penicillium nucicola]KAJ5748071.1 hypothetical protein N7511_009767 [Penicillium nucicola]